MSNHPSASVREPFLADSLEASLTVKDLEAPNTHLQLPAAH